MRKHVTEGIPIGEDRFIRWLMDDHGAYGLIENHPKPNPEARGDYCGGYIAWRQPTPPGTTRVVHQLVSGGPDDVEHLTVAPSLLCRTCGNHGFIRDGAWVPA